MLESSIKLIYNNNYWYTISAFQYQEIDFKLENNLPTNLCATLVFSFLEQQSDSNDLGRYSQPSVLV